MKIAVIAASGKSGVAFVRTALGNGHDVKAGIYSTNPFNSHEHLETIETDATNQEQMDHLIEDVDVVVSLIGHVKNSPNFVQSDAITCALSSMKKHDIVRIVSLTGTGVRRDGDTPSLIDKLANAVIKQIDPKRIADGVKHAEIISKSDTDWTIIRVLKLTDGRPALYHLTETGPAQFMTSRETVAQGILGVLRSDRWVGKMPVISPKKR